jgi:Ca2+-binding EF-hand superfamily protein
MKKSETLEVRLPHETKQAFLTACREDGTTASEVVRGSIDDYLDTRVRPTPQPETGKLLHMIPTPIRKRRYLVGAAGVLALGLAVALPSAAGPDMKAMFDRLDVNHDGILSPEEFAGPKPKEGGNTIIIERHKTTTAANHKPPADAPASGTPQITEKRFTFLLPDGAAPPKDAAPKTVVLERREIRVDVDGATPSEPAVITEDYHKAEFDHFDINKDGKVSFEEYQASQKEMLTNGFNLLDANHDGQLSLAEYSKMGSPMVIADKATDGKAGNDIGADIKVVSKPLLDAGALKAHFKELDKDHNGKLSLQEYLP